MNEDESLREAIEMLDQTGRYDKFKTLNISPQKALSILRSDPGMSKYIICIRKIPLPVLDYLAKNFGESIKERVAVKYPLLHETYEYLAGQSDAIKIRIFCNKKAPESVKERIYKEASGCLKAEIEEWQERFVSRK